MKNDELSKSVDFRSAKKSLLNYFLWRKNRSRSAVERVKKLTNLNGAQILDLGCGYGSLIANLLDEGAVVTGTEIDQKAIDIAKEFLGDRKNYIRSAENLSIYAEDESRGIHTSTAELIKLKKTPAFQAGEVYKIVKVDDDLLPFRDKSFDAVFLFDVIEHVKSPSIILRECQRVLKPGGILYVEFTPYYSVAGHHLYDFTKLPIHILPRKLMGKIIFSRKNQGELNWVNDSWKTFLSLNKIKIGTFQNYLSDYDVIDEKFIVKYPDLFEINVPFLNLLGPFKDFLTMSFVGIYRFT